MSGRQKRSTQLRLEREQVRQRKAVHLLHVARETPALVERLQRLLSTPARDADEARFKAQALRRLADEVEALTSV